VNEVVILRDEGFPDLHMLRQANVEPPHLIRKFGGRSALPLVGPMGPFLDPGCRFSEQQPEGKATIS
jgi:hypothetical protein